MSDGCWLPGCWSLLAALQPCMQPGRHMLIIKSSDSMHSHARQVHYRVVHKGSTSSR